jgi:hypothetical protein
MQAAHRSDEAQPDQERAQWRHEICEAKKASARTQIDALTMQIAAQGSAIGGICRQWIIRADHCQVPAVNDIGHRRL